MDRLKSCNKSEEFIKIYSFHLGVSLSHQPTLVSDNLSIFVVLVFEDPFGADDMDIFRPRNKFPYIISHKLIQPNFHLEKLLLSFSAQIGQGSNGMLHDWSEVCFPF